MQNTSFNRRKFLWGLSQSALSILVLERASQKAITTAGMESALESAERVVSEILRIKTV